MKSIKLAHIEDLAQDFLEPPRVYKTKNEVGIIYDYEMEFEGYGEKSIFFEDIYDFRHVREDEVTSEMIDAAYNSIAKITDSDWLTEEMHRNGYSHFLIYFDDYGAFEVVAKSFRVE